MSKVKKVMATIICAIAIMCCTTQATTVSAATANAPYGYSWNDDNTGNKHIQFYEFDKNLNSYRITRRVMMKNKNLYSNSGALLYSNVKEAGYSATGDLYVILSTGNVEKLTYAGKKVSYKVNAVKLNFDTEDLVVTIMVTGKGNVKLADLASVANPTPTPSPSPSPTPANPTPTPANPTPTPTPSKSKNRVERTATSSGQRITAYKDNKSKLKILVAGSKVLNETASVRLSDTVKGAKFLGIDTTYSVYLYETNGTLYRFKFGSWYSAETMKLNGSFVSSKNDSNGFLNSITTNKGTYKVSSLNKPSVWKAKKTYAVNKTSYVTLYTKGTTTSKTLNLKNGNLYLNGKKVTNKVTKFGFVNAKKFVLIKSGKVFTANITTPTKLKAVNRKKKGTFKPGKLGLVSTATIGGKSVKLS
jgi:hypothetical protein